MTRQLKTFREIESCSIDPLFAAQEVPLDFDENIVAAEGVDQMLRALLAD